MRHPPDPLAPGKRAAKRAPWFDDAGPERCRCATCRTWVRVEEGARVPPLCPVCSRWRAWSLLQPYATLMVCDPEIAPRKIIENRSKLMFRPPPEGRWVAVHASLGWYSTQMEVEAALQWAVGMDEIFPGWRNNPAGWPWPKGALLGAVHVARVYSFATKIDAARALGPQAFGPVCYIIDDARPLPAPIPCKGAMGLWSIPIEHHAALDAIVPEVSGV